MSYEEFLKTLAQQPLLAKIPVVLLTTAPVSSVPNGIREVIEAPIAATDLDTLLKKYRESHQTNVRGSEHEK